MQYIGAHPDFGKTKIALDKKLPWVDDYIKRIKLITHNISKLQKAFRNQNMEVIHIIIEALTEDGRDISHEHRLMGLKYSKGTRATEILDELKPVGDEIVLKKTCSGVFTGTNIDYILRNLGISNLIITGILTNQCVDTAARDAADLGYNVIIPEDACASRKHEIHKMSINILKNTYARIKTTKEVLKIVKEAK